MTLPHDRGAFLLAAHRVSRPWAAKEAGLFSAAAGVARAAAPRVAGAVSNFMANRVAPLVARPFSPIAAQLGGATIKAAPAAAQAAAAAAPAATNTFGHVAWNGVRGALGFGAQEGATGLARGVAGAAGLATIGAPLAVGAMGHGVDGVNPYQRQLGMQVTAAAREPAVYTVKMALSADRIRAGVDLAGYGALAAPLVAKIVAPKFYDRHQGLMHGLDIAGLAALTGTGVYGLATEKKKLPDALDVAGLGLMGLALKRRLDDH